jgi:anti-sigma regulatory factor (Ser/Thr protein kinase)
MELTLKAKDTNLDAVNNFVHSQLPYDCTTQTINMLDLAVEEIFVNIAHYAYDAENTENEVSITCTLEGCTLTIIFSDTGKPFNPLDRPDPDITLSAEQRRIGGLGIYLTKQFMDKVEYEFKNGHNILTIVKDLI